MQFSVGRDGWVARARRVPSANFDMRPDGTLISLLVIHCISLPRGEYGGNAVLALFTNHLDTRAEGPFADLAGVRVSSHFLIRRDGELLQFVSCLHRAWHAGPSTWRGRTRCNDFSIGIELEGVDDQSFTAAQYQVLAALQQALQARYPLRAIQGHCDIAPGRKTDPGTGFDWTQAGRGLTRDRG